MANANVFAQFAQPVRSVAEYLDQYDQQDARREDLAARRQQNAIQSAAMRRQAEADGVATTERNAFAQLAQQYGGDRKALIGALESRGLPGLMMQAQGMRKADLEQANTQSQIDGRASENAKRQAEMSKAQREAATTQIAALNSPDEALALLKAKVDAKEVPPELVPAFTSLIRTDPKWQIKLALAVGDPAKLVETLKPHIQTNNVGGQTVTQAIDPLTGKPTITGAIENTQTKDSIASNARIASDAAAGRAVQMRGQNLSDARARDLNTITKELGITEKELRISEMRGKAEDRALSKNAGKAAVLSQIAVIDKALDHPGRATATGLSGSVDPRNYIPGTSATDFRAVLDQIGGAAFLQAFESLKGGGAITEVEGKKATDAIARLNRAQSDGEFEKSLKELRKVMQDGANRLGAKAEQKPASPSDQKPSVSNW